VLVLEVILVLKDEKTRKSHLIEQRAEKCMMKFLTEKTFSFFGENIFLAKNMAPSINVGRAPYMVTSWDASFS